MEEFINQHASAIFGLVGALGGGLISFLASWLLKKRDYRLQVWNKLLERRIKAHENVITISIEMRCMVPLEGAEENGEVARFPQVLISKDEFEKWFSRFTQITMVGTTWLTKETKRELNFIQDYLVTLYKNLKGVPNEKYPRVGQVIRQDFINLSSSLEKKSFEFFKKEVQQLKIGNLDEWHKYELSETKRRLKDTVLISEWEKIQMYYS